MSHPNFTLITGASSGIGLELARLAARNGENLILVARDSGKLSQVKQELAPKVTIHALAIDLSLARSAQAVFDYCKQREVIVSCLINDAGFGDFGEFATSDLEVQQNMIDVNIRTLTSLTRLFLPQMIAQKSGKIMNLGSTASFLPGPLMSVYYGSKHYVLIFSESLAEELRGSGISVTCLCPGPTASGFSVAAHASKSRLFSSRNLPSAQAVAEFGWHAMQNGQRVAIYGLSNRVLVHLAKFVPRPLLAQLVKKWQS